MMADGSIVIRRVTGQKCVHVSLYTCASKM